MTSYPASNASPNTHSLANAKGHGTECTGTGIVKDPAVAAHLADAKEASSRMHSMLDTLGARLSGLCGLTERPGGPVAERPMHGSSEMARVIRDLEHSFEAAENRLCDLLSRLEI